MSLLSIANYLMAEDKPKFDPNSVTPGVIGFAATFLVILAAVALVLDMVRRVRRTQYRSEVNALLDAEEAAAAQRDTEGLNRASEGTDDEPNGETPER